MIGSTRDFMAQSMTNLLKPPAPKFFPMKKVQDMTNHSGFTQHMFKDNIIFKTNNYTYYTIAVLRLCISTLLHRDSKVWPCWTTPNCMRPMAAWQKESQKLGKWWSFGDKPFITVYTLSMPVGTQACGNFRNTGEHIVFSIEPLGFRTISGWWFQPLWQNISQLG